MSVLRFSAVAFDASSLLSGAVLGVAGKWALDILSTWFNHHLQIRRDRESQKLKRAEEEWLGNRDRQRQTELKRQEAQELLGKHENELLRLKECLARSRPSQLDAVPMDFDQALTNIRTFFEKHPEYLRIEANRQYVRQFCAPAFMHDLPWATAFGKKQIEEAIGKAEALRIHLNESDLIIGPPPRAS